MRVLLTWSPTATEREIIDTEWPVEADVLVVDDLTDDEFDAALPDVEAMVGYMRTIPRDRLGDSGKLRLIHVLGHGADALLTPQVVEQLQARRVQVARSNPCAIPIAEFAIMGMIALTRRAIPLHNALTLRGDWSTDLWARRGEGVLGGELHGSTLGIVGYGNIATEIHRRAEAFGMTVGALARHPDDLSGSGLDFVHAWAELSDFLGACDYVTLTVPLTASTRHLIGRDEISAMRRGSYLINVGRGALADEEAVWEGLTSGRLAGAALDVFETEDTGGRHGYPVSRPMHHLNTLLTPHYSGATAEARERALTVVGENLRNLHAGRPIRNSVRLDRGF